MRSVTSSAINTNSMAREPQCSINATGVTAMLAKTIIALSTALVLAGASTATAMTNPRNGTFARGAVVQKSTIAAAHQRLPTSLAQKAWLDHHQLGYGI
jgi:hypothetical protein